MSQIKGGAILSYITIAVNNLVILLYTPFMLRTMGQSEYGLYSLVMSVIAYLTVLDLGFGNAIIRYTAKFRAESKGESLYEMFGMFILLYLVLGLVAVVFGGLLTWNTEVLFGDSLTEGELYKVKIMFILLTFNVGFTFPMSVFSSIVVAYERFIFQKGLNLIRVVLNPIAMVVMLLLGYRAIGMVVITTLFNVVTLLFNYFYCFKKLKIKVVFGHYDWSLLKNISFYSFWIFLGMIVDRVYWSSGQFIIGMFRGAKDVAVYGIGIQIASFFMSFATAISSVFLPRVTMMHTNQKSVKEYSNLLIRVGRLQYAVMVFVLSGFIIFGRSFVLLWAGEEYFMAYYVALLLMIPLTILLIQNLGITIIQAMNKVKFRALSTLAISCITLLLSMALTKKYGVLGTAISIGFAFLTTSFVMNIFYFKKMSLDIRQFWIEVLKMSPIPFLMIFILRYLIPIGDSVFSYQELFLYIALYSLVFGGLFISFSLNASERQLLLSLIKRK